MNKRGKALKIISIVFLILILLIIATAAYFYFFHVFYTFRICVSNNIQDLKVPCADSQECIDSVLGNMSSDEKSQMQSIPEIAKEKIDQAFNSAVFCEQTCKVKEIYGGGIGGVQEVSECKTGETEIKLEIRGKEGLQLYGYLKENNLI